MDKGVFITSEPGRFVPVPGATCDGGQDADTAPEPPPAAPAPQSTAALRSAGDHGRRFLPHARSQSQERNHLEQDLINLRGGDFYLATSGDKNLAGALSVTRAAGVACGVRITAFVILVGVRA